MSQKKPLKKTDAPATPDKPSDTALNSTRLFLFMGAIAVITLISFAPAMKASFINQDDNIYVFDNLTLAKPLPEAIGFFFAPHYFSGNYIPLTMIVYSLVFQASGIVPEVFHTVNIFIHLGNVLLVFWFIYLLSGRKPGVAALTALFFGIHPMHVESVAWVAELKDVLYTFFFIAGLIAYCKYSAWNNTAPARLPGADQKANEQKPPGKKSFPRFLLATFIFFFLSVLSKPAAIVFPVVLLLLDFYNRRKFDKWVWLEKLPFFAVSLIFGVVSIIAQRADDLINNYYPFTQRIYFASYAFLDYIVKLFLPVNLSNFYPYPALINGHLPYFFYIAPAVVIILFYGIYRTLKYTRLVAFGSLFFLVNLVLVLQLLSLGNAIMADRYSYVPYIGLFFILAMYFDRLYHSASPKLSSYKTVFLTVVVLLAVTCSYLTYARCGVWQNQDTVSIDVLDKYPDDRITLNNRGYILFVQKRYPEALVMFKKAIQIKPDYLMPYINMANSYLEMKDYDDAMKITDTALKYTNQDYHMLSKKGYLFFMKQRYAEALQLYKAAEAAKKDDLNNLMCLAQCYFMMKDYDNWVKTIDIALGYFPDNYILLNNKGFSLMKMGKYDQSLEYLKASLKIKPDYKVALANLSDCYLAMGDSSRARN